MPRRDLPMEFGAWQTAQSRFETWSADGTLNPVHGGARVPLVHRAAVLVQSDDLQRPQLLRPVPGGR